MLANFAYGCEPINRLRDIQEILNNLELVYNYLRKCPENFKKNYYPELEISKNNLTSVGKWDNEKTERQTRNLK